MTREEQSLKLKEIEQCKSQIDAIETFIRSREHRPGNTMIRLINKVVGRPKYYGRTDIVLRNNIFYNDCNICASSRLTGAIDNALKKELTLLREEMDILLGEN